MGSLLALSLLASIAAALVVVGVAHAARNDERGVPYRNAVDVAALHAKGIANDERGYLLRGDPTFIAEARERTGLARAALDDAVRSATTAEEATAASTVSQGFEAWVTAVQRGFADYRAGRRSQAVAASIGPSRELRKTYEDNLARAQSLADSSEHAATTSLTRLIHDSLAILLISLAIVLAIGLCLSFWLVRSVALPVYRIAEMLGPGTPQQIVAISETPPLDVNMPRVDLPDHPDVQSSGAYPESEPRPVGPVSVTDLLNRRRQGAARGGVEVLRSEVIDVRQRFDGRVDFHARRVSDPPDAQQADTVDARDATDRGGGPSRSVRR